MLDRFDTKDDAIVLQKKMDNSVLFNPNELFQPEKESQTRYLKKMLCEEQSISFDPLDDILYAKKTQRRGQ